MSTSDTKKIQITLKSSVSIPPNVVIRKIPLKLKASNQVIRKKLQLKTQPKNPIDQLNKYLDEHFLHHLMYLKDSWSEVKHKIRLDNNGQECWWDLELLLLHFAEQLNVSCMSAPSPQWPSNPFNRVPFDRSQLQHLGKQIKVLQLPVNDMVTELFDYLLCKSVPIEQFTGSFIGFVSQRYRYRVINCKDSQGNYLGYWVKRSQPMTLFERRYRDLTQIPPSEYEAITDRIIPRPEYLFYKEILDAMPLESIELTQLTQSGGQTL